MFGKTLLTKYKIMKVIVKHTRTKADLLLEEADKLVKNVNKSILESIETRQIIENTVTGKAGEVELF